jgi:hypothetical protein
MTKPKLRVDASVAHDATLIKPRDTLTVKFTAEKFRLIG